MDYLFAMGIFVVGLLMMFGGFGGKIVIRLPFIEFVGLAGVFMMLLGVAGMIGYI